MFLGNPRIHNRDEPRIAAHSFALNAHTNLTVHLAYQVSRSENYDYSLKGKRIRSDE